MEGVREKEKGAPLACVLTDGLTPEHGTVCYHAYWYAQIVIWLNLLSCHVLLLFFCVCVCFFLNLIWNMQKTKNPGKGQKWFSVYTAKFKYFLKQCYQQKQELQL